MRQRYRAYHGHLTGISTLANPRHKITRPVKCWGCRDRFAKSTLTNFCATCSDTIRQENQSSYYRQARNVTRYTKVADTTLVKKVLAVKYK